MAGENKDAGKQIGNYSILSRIAGGAFGSDYLARHAIFAKRPLVAIKLLHAHLNSQEERDRFLQEAQWLEMLQHPHILSIFDAGIHENYPYLVTEYAPNGSLAGRIKRLSTEPLSMQECLSILAQVEEALTYAHKQNIIHRDLTPGNILFNAQDEVLLADFGVATMLATASIKRTANPIGTPPYMAPEQFQGEISKEIDQYALGCIAYELFTGHRPFTGSAAELMYKHINISPLPPRQRNPDLPESIERAILKALAKKRTDRSSDVSAFVAALKGEPQIQSLNKSSENHQQSQPLPLPKKSVDSALLLPPLLNPAETLPLPTETAHSLPSSPFIPPIPKSVVEPKILLPNPPITSPNTGRPPIMNTAGVAQQERTPDHTLDAVAMFPASTNPGGRSRSISSALSSFWPRWFITLALILLILSLLFGGIALAVPSTFASLRNLMLRAVGAVSSSNTVTITPKSADLHNTYVITGVTTGTPDSAKRQVRARILTPVTETQGKTAAATGILNTPATRATGTLTFFNGSNVDLVVKASAFVISVNGVQIKLNADVDVPAATPNGIGTINAAAYADPPGSNGNIPAGAINQFCCGSSSLSVKNLAAFGGGKDASTETIVQQSDINNAANPLEGSLKQTALASPNFKRQAGEQFLPNSPQCTTNVTSDHAAGEQAQSVTVTVTVRCSGEVYDQSGAQVIAANLLRSEAAKGAGPGYALVGTIVTTVTQPPTVGNAGAVTLFVRAEGIWVYQFSSAQKAALAGLIAGKSQSEANALLLQQAGVQKVNSIVLSGGTTLPTDAKQIVIVVENVPGIQGTPGGTPGPGTPTFTTSPIPRPSPSTVPGK